MSLGRDAVALAPNTTPVPIPGNDFIPTFPYASGHYTNGAVWAQDLAAALGLSASPSLLGGNELWFRQRPHGAPETWSVSAKPRDPGGPLPSPERQHGARQRALRGSGGWRQCAGCPQCRRGLP